MKPQNIALEDGGRFPLMVLITFNNFQHEIEAARKIALFKLTVESLLSSVSCSGNSICNRKYNWLTIRIYVVIVTKIFPQIGASINIE